MTGVHKGAALTQQGLGTAKSFITDKLSQGAKWLTGQVEEKGIEQVENFPVGSLDLNYDAEQELWEKGLTENVVDSSLKSEKDSIEKQALTKVPLIRKSILEEVPKRLYNKFMEGAESGVKEFGYNILGGKGSNSQGTMDQPNDLGGTVGFTYEPYDFINNRTSVPLNALNLDLKNTYGATYGGIDYMAEASKVMKPIESFWNPEILTS